MRGARVLRFVLACGFVAACGGESTDAGSSAPPVTTADASCACTARDATCRGWLADHCLGALGCPPTFGDALEADKWEAKTLYVQCTNGESEFETLEVGRGYSLRFDEHGTLFYASEEGHGAVCGSPTSIDFKPSGVTCYRCVIGPEGTELYPHREVSPCLVDDTGRLMSQLP